MATHSSILAWRIPVDRGAWRATVHGVTKSQTRLSNSAVAATVPKLAVYYVKKKWGNMKGTLLAGRLEKILLQNYKQYYANTEKERLSPNEGP